MPLFQFALQVRSPPSSPSIAMMALPVQHSTRLPQRCPPALLGVALSLRAGRPFELSAWGVDLVARPPLSTAVSGEGAGPRGLGRDVYLLLMSPRCVLSHPACCLVPVRRHHSRCCQDRLALEAHGTSAGSWAFPPSAS